MSIKFRKQIGWLIYVLSALPCTLQADGRMVLKQVLLERAMTHGFRVGIASLGEIIAVDARLSDGSTLLHLAARNGEDYIVDGLLEKGANPHAEDSQGRTSYKVAVKSGQPRSAALLLSQMNGVNALDDWSRSPVNIATRDTGDKVSALNRGYMVAIKLMLKGADADLGAIEDNELRYLRGLGHVSDDELQAALLTNAHVIPYFAADNDLDNLKRALRLIPADYNEQHLNRAFLIAASNPDTMAMDVLIAYGVDAREAHDGGFGLTPLMVAINNNSRLGVKRLLWELRVNPNVQDQFGNTALHHACTRGGGGCSMFVRDLIIAGADPMIMNDRCCAPLVLAVMVREFRSARTILAAMPDLRILKKLVTKPDGRLDTGAKIIIDAIEYDEDFRQMFADVADELEYLNSNVFSRMLQKIFTRNKKNLTGTPVSSK